MPKVHVNDTEWSNLQEDERQQITEIMTNTRLLSSPDDIEPQAADIDLHAVAPLAEDAPQASAPNQSVPQALCEIAVGAAETAAVAACQTLGNPIAVTACVAIAHLAAKTARAECGKLP